MKVIITGASGFVGQNLSKYLIAGGNSVEQLSLRQNSEFSVSAADAFIHLAGKAHDTINTTADSEYYQVNTELTKSVFDKFLISDIQDFIYFSSVKAVADSVSNVLEETTVAKPKTHYGRSKLMAENYITSKVIPNGKRVIIIRPCMIHGPGNKGNLNLLYNIVQKKLPWPLAAFDNKRSFLSIDNLNFLIGEILNNRNISSGIYQFADDYPISTNELIKIISKILGNHAQLWRIPKQFMLGIAKVGDMLKLPLNSERLKKLTENYVVSNEKIKKEMGINTLPISTEQGLINTILSFKK